MSKPDLDSLLSRIATSPPDSWRGPAPVRGAYEQLGLDLLAARTEHPDIYAAELADAVAARDWPDPLPLEGFAALQAWATLVPELTFSLGLAGGAADEVDALIASGLLRRVAAFGFVRGELPDASVTALAGCPDLANVRQLTLAHLTMSGEALEALASSPHLGGVTALQVLQITAPAEAIAKLARRLGPELTFLKVVKAGLTGELVGEMFAEPWPALASLQLPVNPIGDEGARHLAAATLPALTDLDLDLCKLTSAGVAALADSPVMSRVEDLTLSRNESPLTEGVQALAASPHVRAIQRLDLNDCGIKDDGVRAIAGSGWALRSLKLRRCYVFNPDALASAAFIGELEAFDLSDNSSLDAWSLRGLLASPLKQVFKDDLEYEYAG